VWRLLLLYLCPRERQREQWDARNLGHAYTPQLGQPKEPGVVLALSTALGVPNLPDFPNLSAALGVCGAPDVPFCARPAKQAAEPDRAPQHEHGQVQQHARPVRAQPHRTLAGTRRAQLAQHSQRQSDHPSLVQRRVSWWLCVQPQLGRQQLAHANRAELLAPRAQVRPANQT
jgi:hypothetical protein